MTTTVAGPLKLILALSPSGSAAQGFAARVKELTWFGMTPRKKEKERNTAVTGGALNS